MSRRYLKERAGCAGPGKGLPGPCSSDWAGRKNDGMSIAIVSGSSAAHPSHSLTPELEQPSDAASQSQSMHVSRIWLGTCPIGLLARRCVGRRPCALRAPWGVRRSSQSYVDRTSTSSRGQVLDMSESVSTLSLSPQTWHRAFRHTPEPWYSQNRAILAHADDV